jgi:hypothetical protein
MAVVVPGKILFLANPRTGSQAVTKYLVDNYPEAIWSKCRHHATLKELAGFNPKLLGCGNYHLDDEVTCTTVRNHWDIIVSWWLLMYPEGCVRVRELEWFIWNGTHSYFAKGNKLFWLHYADVYLKYETLEDDLGRLLNRNVKLPHIGKTENKKNYKSYYDKDSWEAVYERFHEEIEMFGYGHEEYENGATEAAN